MSALADADGLPEALRLASCGRRVFAQFRRVDHDTGTPASIEACDTGVHVFHAHTGVRAAEKAIDVGFAPIEVVASR